MTIPSTTKGAMSIRRRLSRSNTNTAAGTNIGNNTNAIET
jgi:hypothetical protein